MRGPMLAHVFFEWAAYVVGLGLYWRSRDATSQPPEAWRRLGIVAAAIAGAAVGSKLLYVADYWSTLARAPWPDWAAGKTIVGALLGGLVGVEIVKKATGWERSTGDAFVLPLVIGMIVGRVGCQLSDARDLTYGIPTSLPWGWNYGDGVPRHPTALYEIVALALIGWAILRSKRLRAQSGNRFRALMVGYLALRFALDFLKPPHGLAIAGAPVPDSFAHLSAIQWACLAGLAYYGIDELLRIRARHDACHRPANGSRKVVPEL